MIPSKDLYLVPLSQGSGNGQGLNAQEARHLRLRPSCEKGCTGQTCNKWTCLILPNEDRLFMELFGWRNGYWMDEWKMYLCLVEPGCIAYGGLWFILYRYLLIRWLMWCICESELQWRQRRQSAGGSSILAKEICLIRLTSQSASTRFVDTKTPSCECELLLVEELSTHSYGDLMTCV